MTTPGLAKRRARPEWEDLPGRTIQRTGRRPVEHIKVSPKAVAAFETDGCPLLVQAQLRDVLMAMDKLGLKVHIILPEGVRTRGWPESAKRASP